MNNVIRDQTEEITLLDVPFLQPQGGDQVLDENLAKIQDKILLTVDLAMAIKIREIFLTDETRLDHPEGAEAPQIKVEAIAEVTNVE